MINTRTIFFRRNIIAFIYRILLNTILRLASVSLTRKKNVNFLEKIIFRDSTTSVSLIFAHIKEILNSINLEKSKKFIALNQIPKISFFVQNYLCRLFRASSKYQNLSYIA